MWPKLLVLVGEFAKLRKATFNFVMSVCPSVRVELCSHWKDFHEIGYLCIFRKLAQKIQVSLKSNKNNRYFTGRPIHIFDHIYLSYWNVKCFRQ